MSDDNTARRVYDLAFIIPLAALRLALWHGNAWKFPLMAGQDEYPVRDIRQMSR